VDKLIPFNKPYVPEVSKRYALEVLESNHQQGDGPFTARASKMVSNLVGGGHVLLTPSCTHALEMASMLGNIGPGDEVILPSYTFTSAATAVAKFGATPVFVDIEKETKGIDVNQVRDALTAKTKAVSWVNYAGVAPDIEGLQSLAKEFDLLLIEDNAHGLGGSYKGRPLGSFGDFATQSFHATKNIQCGEGGALVINAPHFIERAEIIREKGTDRKKYVNQEVQKYQWVDHGSSYLMAEVLAAQLLGQLENFEMIQKRRKSKPHAHRHLPFVRTLWLLRI
jgi:dTDP-4-amino-4,6-dideoxygalactose transaminase